MIYIDSNVVIDILTRDPSWYEWSRVELRNAQASERLVTGHVVAAELAHRAASCNELETGLGSLGIEVLGMDMNAAFLSGQAYREYRLRGGERTSLLPDFLIGGHAMALGATLLTRDARRFRSYFPDLDLITPEESND